MQNEELQDYNEPLKVELHRLSEKPAVISPDNPHWGSLAAIGFWLTSVLFILILPVFFVLPYARSQNIGLADSVALNQFLTTDKTAILLNIIAVIPAHLLTIILAWVIITRLKKYPFLESLGWKWGGFKIWHGLLILVGFFILSGVVSSFFPEQDNDLLKILRSSRTVTLLVAVIATFSAPIVEEVVYRGVLYSAFQKTFGKATSIILVTLLFTIVHVPQYYPSYSTISLLLLLSLILTLVRARTENLLPCVALHFVFNGIQSALLILEPYFPKPPADVQETAVLISQWLG